ncbi:MAG: hypothetical protein KA760_02590 [Steroidobacteraceae bacterium]|jgi:hypothetical protein|nr:hypothetical protein [Steroidobacteraceae bacterium]MBP9130425.1 hypothetical protein [Steroidobacteraceae bacterium]
MFKKTLLAIIAVCGVAPTAWSQAGKVLYTGIESSTDYVTVPSSASGTWSITPCAGCSMLHLKLDASTEYFVGRDRVSLATLRKYAARGSNNLVVAYETKTLRVTQLKLGMQLEAADMPAKQPARVPQGGATESRTKS